MVPPGAFGTFRLLSCWSSSWIDGSMDLFYSDHIKQTIGPSAKHRSTVLEYSEVE